MWPKDDLTRTLAEDTQKLLNCLPCEGEARQVVGAHVFADLLGERGVSKPFEDKPCEAALWGERTFWEAWA